MPRKDYGKNRYLGHDPAGTLSGKFQYKSHFKFADQNFEHTRARSIVRKIHFRILSPIYRHIIKKQKPKSLL